MYTKRVRGIARGWFPCPNCFALKVFLLNLNLNSTSCPNWGEGGEGRSYLIPSQESPSSYVRKIAKPGDDAGLIGSDFVIYF